MSTGRQLARQWLETDAAFGVAEVPVAREVSRAAVAAAVVIPAPVRAVVQRPAVVFSPAPGRSMEAVRPVVRQIVPVARPAVAVEVEDSMGTRAAKVAIPAAPDGDIASLPAVLDADKPRLLDALLTECTLASAAFINDISTRVVFGEGSAAAGILFIGEGPGVEEDRTGRPFVGKSGQLLDKMIVAMGYSRESVYIANVVKLRAAEWDEALGRMKDRAPNPEEVARGIPFLHRQIEIIRPAVIVTLGGPALKYVTGEKEGVMKVRGQWRSYRGIPVMPTYHPAFVLRAYTPENRGKVWSDLQLVMQRLKDG